MKDRAALLPNRRKITYEDGSVDFVTFEYADQPTEVGTVLDKSALLSDAASTALGLTQSDPVPSDAFIKLGNFSTSVSSNLLINGGFDIWQRGTSFNSAGYTADRWVLAYDGTGATRAVTRQAFTVGQTDVPSNPTYFLRYNQSVAGSSGTYNTIEQRIENVRTSAGQAVTFSFYAKADSARNLVSTSQQVFGSGGSSGVYAGNTTHAVTTAWQKFTQTITLQSISGKTIGANNYLSLIFSFPLNSTFTFDIANVQLNYGAVAMPFVPASFDNALRSCQRYYEKSYDLAVVQGTANVSAGLWFTNVLAVATSNGARWPIGSHPRFKVRKRIAPTITLYTYEGTAGQWATGGGNRATSYGSDESGFFVGNNTGGSVTPTAGEAYGHWTADAEL